MVLDDAQIMVHNGGDHQFKHGQNELFSGKTNSQVKSYFFSGMSDTN